MKIRHYIIICSISILLGMLFLVFQQEIIVFNYPRNNLSENPIVKATKKNISLIFWHRDHWKTEQQELIWHNDNGKNIYYLINSWLTLLHEENIMHKKVSLQSVLMSDTNHEAYLSFDRNPFYKQQTTFEKWMFIEGLLKTIAQNKISIQQVQILVHHQPLQDMHLDFSKPWPLNGFLN